MDERVKLIVIINPNNPTGAVMPRAELEKIGLPWCTPNGTKVNYHLKHQLDMYKAMADSGCYQITIACESGSQRVLDDLIDKRLPLETIYPAIEKAKNKIEKTELEEVENA